MKQSDFPYCIPDKRELTAVERRLLQHLAAESIEIASHMDDLKVVARCGCGECPTILFGKTLDDEPITSRDSGWVGAWTGRAPNGTLVGIALAAVDGVPVELEAWSVDGGEFDSWPPLSEIRLTES